MALRLSACSCRHFASSSSLCSKMDFEASKRCTSFRFSSCAHSTCRCARRMTPRAWRKRRLASSEVSRACWSSMFTPSRSKGWPPESSTPASAVSPHRRASRTSARHAQQSSEAKVLQPCISTQTWHCVIHDWSSLPHSFRHPVMIGRRSAARAVFCLEPARRLCRLAPGGAGTGSCPPPRRELQGTKSKMAARSRIWGCGC
mmetsp:Transcript_29764/g.80500  ORF Transcript_29764/g.80500 Transcript_29764/m.80500 type:complete len:202 (-) Transcript_29764:117-722(-)